MSTTLRRNTCTHTCVYTHGLCNLWDLSSKRLYQNATFWRNKMVWYTIIQIATKDILPKNDTVCIMLFRSWWKSIRYHVLDTLIILIEFWKKIMTWHYTDVIMGAMASQITSLTIVYSTVFQTEIKENITASRHWPLCGEFTGWIPHKWPVTRKMFPFDDVIMETDGQYEDLCARSRYQEQGEVIISHVITCPCPWYLLVANRSPYEPADCPVSRGTSVPAVRTWLVYHEISMLHILMISHKSFFGEWRDAGISVTEILTWTPYIYIYCNLQMLCQHVQ